MTTHVLVAVGDERYAISVDHITEVAELGSLTPVPGARASVLGVFNLRGEILPVYDLASVLNIPRGTGRYRLAVLECAGQRIGIAVDEVTDVGDMPEPEGRTEFALLLGATIVDGCLVGFIDVHALFAAVASESP